ncbi:MAG: molybdate ABC transporter substrate-binding protein [Deltaproteobacteria bacterium]|jgi:molybdate transport system substrate-binding protein|nr:molybdate ABC transporter substrate-binding protein [Deltaproteobacteria bacterium]MCL5880893.1 molybdate ABC transporter substrate-binding protein [Deltaproteobacteria bacterium]MDA8303724.1 molybdate ABC transporter substrate-binding protein [Deltaproteobacteria bacterium]
MKNRVKPILKFKYLPLFLTGLFINFAGFAMLGNPAANAATLRIMAADALPKPLTEIGNIFKKEHPGVKIDYDFMGSGVLKGDIEEGAPCDIFLSANGKFQRQLKRKGFLNSYRVFAYDYLAAATPYNNPAHITKSNLIQKLMDSNVVLTTSSPHSDPAGDYTWKMFKIIGKNIPGAFEKITNHVNHLLDAAMVMPVLESGNTDLGILYTSQLLELKRSGAKINIIPIPEKYNSRAKFTVSILNQSKHKVIDRDFIKLLFSKKGKKILKRWGFSPVK